MAKLDVLTALHELGSITARELAGTLGVEPPAAGMALLRLVRQRLVAREIDSSPARHFLTAKGMARLMYLHSRRAAVCDLCGLVGEPGAQGLIHAGCGGLMR
jgi:DNA-binding MarR family transcriptional regulator